MKNLLIPIFVILSSCKSVQHADGETDSGKKAVDCVLDLLPKTVDYENEIENYISIYKDTVIELEYKINGLNKYKTILDLRKAERFVWLLELGVVESDSLLIHCITPTKSVDSEFIVENCEIEIQITDYDKRGEPITTSIKMVKI